ncbi:MAG: SDR family oxidoreductase [Halobacteria archaeon]|nr:SDR family oxidoreductase [Halobacteria archaeon]
MTSLEGQTVLVTGASKGMGREMALRFADEGAKVVLVARDGDELDDVAKEANGETLVATADVRNPQEVEATVDVAVDEFGSIDTLVNNAGVGLLSLYDERKDLVDVSEEDWDTVIETNLKGVFLFTKYVLPSMESGGNVINISSGLGRKAAEGWSPYVTSKWGLEGLTRTVALEVEDDGVNVNGVYPGGRVETGFWKHLPEEERDEILPPDVMNDAAVLLAQQDKNGVTGESISADDWEERLG